LYATFFCSQVIHSFCLYLKGMLVRLKKGVYCRSDLHDPFLVASVLHDASCVSFETALGYYNFIHEQVKTVLSVTTGRTANFQTPLGSFSYHHQETSLFAKGMDLIVVEQPDGSPVGTGFIASPEKALLDTIARARLQGVSLSPNDVLAWCVDCLRIEPEDLRSLSLRQLVVMGALYRTHAPQKLSIALR
jgi:hypothetical protein